MARSARFVTVTACYEDQDADYVLHTPTLPWGASQNAKRWRPKGAVVFFEDGPYFPPINVQFDVGRFAHFPAVILQREEEILAVRQDDPLDPEDPMDEPDALAIGSSALLGGKHSVTQSQINARHRARRGSPRGPSLNAPLESLDPSRAYAEGRRAEIYRWRPLGPSQAALSLFPVMFCTEGRCNRRASVWNRWTMIKRRQETLHLDAYCLVHLPFPSEEAPEIVGDTSRRGQQYHRCHPLPLEQHQALRKTTVTQAYRFSPEVAFLGPIERARLVHRIIMERRRESVERR